MQIQANVLQRPLVRPAMQETTALGASRLAFEALQALRRGLRRRSVCLSRTLIWSRSLRAGRRHGRRFRRFLQHASRKGS